MRNCVGLVVIGLGFTGSGWGFWMKVIALWSG